MNTHDALMKQYQLVNELAAQKDAIVGDDPHREMNGEELRSLIIADHELTKAWNEMKRLEALDAEQREHPSEQADF
jgi:hypothetical protein